MNTELPSSLALHLAGNVRSVRRRYRKRLGRCQKKFSETAVHDLRVESRRILALIDLLEALCFAAPLKKIARNFKRRLDSFDDLRDTHVQRRLLRPMWCDFPEACGLKTFLAQREKKLGAKLARKLQGVKFGRLNRQLKQIEKCLRRCRDRTTPRRTGEVVASDILRTTFQRVAALRRLVRRQNPATIHCLRVAFKRFRYMNELLQPLLPGVTAKRLERMKEYQAAAGDVQDLEVLLAQLASIVECGELKSSEVKRLRSELLRRRRRAINSFAARMDGLFEFGQVPSAAKRKRN